MNRPLYSRLWPMAGALLALPGCQSGPSGKTTGTAASAPPSAIRYADATAGAGIRFKHFTGADGRYLMPESVGPGGAFFDYDGDGWLDIYLVNSTGWPGHPAPGKTGALYRNLHDGTFREVTREAGLAVPMYGQGCAVGDFDQDGRDDLLITCVGSNHLFRNLGQGRFAEVTASSGLGGGGPWDWHTSAAWLDYDHDGRLDLFVCRYVRWSPKTDVACKTATGARTYCGPVQYTAQPSLLYRNLGNGKFQDVSAATGIAAVPGKGLGVVPVDENGDGWDDLFVSNDLVANHLWRNGGGKKFQEVAQEGGVAVADSGAPRAGMGVDVADTRNADDLSFAVGNFAGEGLALFRRNPSGYADEGRSAGLVPPSLTRLTFGLTFLDADRDGWADLFTYNGHVDPHAGEGGEMFRYRQAPQLFRNQRGAFADVTSSAGPPLQELQVGRGCAQGDFDNDGRPDLLLCENAGPTRLLRNVSPDRHHWVGVQLRGRAGNRDGYGAEVRLTAGGITQRRWVHSGSSYLSASDPRALFGLGDAAQADRLEVRWPSGRTSELPAPALDRYLEVVEPAR
jgi:hypothetical protein